ncbi:MAG TPA: type II secretion system protein GspM [Gemmatimonadales bacterium]|nr:type II secretion system protein GspM [Gemmatimonadales bacterium]
MKPRDRRALLWGVGVVAGAWMALRGVPAGVRAVRALRERTVTQVETLARAEDVVLRGPAVRDSMAQAFRAIVALAPDLEDGEGPADAEASLSALVSLAANRHALKVVRADPLPDSTMGAFHRVALHAEVEGDLGGVTGLLTTLETRTPLLTVSRFSLEAPDPVPHPRTPEVLHLSLDVSGYYLPRAK